MLIKYLGHSSFFIRSSHGTKILTDPFDGSIDYKPYEGAVDITTISHIHGDHSYLKNLPKNTTILDSVGYYNFNDIKITGILSYHDKYQGALRGNNIIFLIEIDGYRICHLGDLGHILNNDEIINLGDIDVLFVPIGGNITLGGKEASVLCQKVNPKIIIPMHYKTPRIKINLEGVDKFFKYMKNGEKLVSNSIEFNGDITKKNYVTILHY